MINAIIVLAIVLGLGLRLARWVEGLPPRAIDAMRPGAEPRPRGPAGAFGTGL
jgi:hypothetical protein